ncbi:MAG: phenylacetate--CoA ligase family protein [Bacillota bacterium]
MNESILPRYTPDELKQLQLERLQAALNRAYMNIPAYKKKLDQAGIPPERVISLENLTELPFTTRRELLDNYPYNMFAVTLREIVRVHSISQFSGKPIVVGYTGNDLRNLREITARTLCMAGVTRDDIVQITYQQGMFLSALGLQQGAEYLEAAVVPVTAENFDEECLLLKDYKISVLVTLPSFALRLGRAVRNLHIHPNELNLRLLILGGEPCPEEMRAEIEKLLPVKAFIFYGSDELMGPGIASECNSHHGLHLWEDHFLAEVIDPSNGIAAPEGQEGELVITTLTKEAYPLIRYRTGEKTAFIPCRCMDADFRAIKNITGRADDGFLVRGLYLSTQHLSEMLGEIEGTAPEFILLINSPEDKEELELWVEIEEKLFGDTLKHIQKMEGQIIREFTKRANLSVRVKVVEPKTIMNTFGFSRRIINSALKKP